MDAKLLIFSLSSFLIQTFKAIYFPYNSASELTSEFLIETQHVQNQSLDLFPLPILSAVLLVLSMQLHFSSCWDPNTSSHPYLLFLSYASSSLWANAISQTFNMSKIQALYPHPSYYQSALNGHHFSLNYCNSLPNGLLALGLQRSILNIASEWFIH